MSRPVLSVGLTCLHVAHWHMSIGALLAFCNGRDWRPPEVLLEPNGLDMSSHLVLDSYSSRTEKVTVSLVHTAAGIQTFGSLQRQVDTAIGVEFVRMWSEGVRSEERRLKGHGSSGCRPRCIPGWETRGLVPLRRPAERGMEI